MSFFFFNPNPTSGPITKEGSMTLFSLSQEASWSNKANSGETAVGRNRAGRGVVLCAD